MPDEYYDVPIPQMGIPQQPKSDRPDLIDKIKPDLMVEIIRHKLLGEELIQGKWKKIESLKNIALSEIGAWELSNIMLGVSSINISVSKLSDSEIKVRARSIAYTVQMMLVQSWIAYEIKNTAQMRFVHEIIFSNTLAVLKQADNASIQELLKATIYENRMVSEQRPSKDNKFKRILGL